MRRLLLALIALPLLLGASWPDDRVYVVDQTRGDYWRVAAVAEAWDNGSALNLRYARSCPYSGAQCIYVRVAALTPGLAGYADTKVNSRTGYTARVDVALSSDLRYAPVQTRRSVACHEIGHAIGLRHRYDPESCMFPTLAGATRGTAADYRRLEALYGP